ncbi:DNA-binding CsgD family transcriptional regulator/GAF domain-containing protein [Labrenzia sp. EL_159]|nr:DNA-binding CsgD family transcriptional regulator/GAF domain-containing protein [Labrenzia sp. EL_162]MBG6193564.1 DNA-binding CsgD family transcriptional regulator/GAF domain-containing protein [Labrenzia sp. EL_159]
MQPEKSLSPRELEIARCYAHGETYHAIAERLHIAPSTVRTHLAAIYRKLEVSSKLELHSRLEGKGRQQMNQSDHAAVISELALSLEEAIGREKALSEVLRIISRSRGDIDDVMAAILGHALILCDAEFGILFEYRRNRRFSARFSRGIPAEFKDWLEAQGVFAVSAETGLGRMETVQYIINIVDVRSEELYRTEDPLRAATADLGGARSFVAIPMLSGDSLVGAFTIYRQQVRPFNAQVTALAQTFADQSVIALDNARMISELRAVAQVE